MPLSYAPAIRQRQKAMETNGLIQARDSVGYTERSAQEGVTQPLPVNWPSGSNDFFYFRGTRYTPTN